MNKMKRKLVALLCTMVMVASVLGGCGQEKQESVASSTPTSESKQEEAKESASEVKEEEALEFVELNWYVRDYGTATDIDIVQAAVDAYFLEKLNCKVNLHVMPANDFKEKMPTALMSGEQIDIVQISEIGYESYADMGALYPMDELLEQYGQKAKALFTEDVWESLRRPDGNIYTIPTLRDNSYIMGISYNVGLAEELGLDIQSLDWKTLADMDEEMLVAAKERRDELHPEWKDMPLIAGTGINVPNAFIVERFVNEYACTNVPGLEIAPEYDDSKVFCLYETDAYREAILLKQRLVASGVSAYNYSEFERNVVYEPSTLFGPQWGLTYIAPNYYSEDFDVDLKIWDTAIWADGTAYTAACTSIGVNCVDPERAMMVLELANSDEELATLLRFGVEGTHWERDAEGKIQFAGNNDPSLEAKGWEQWYGVNFGNVTIADGPESRVGKDRLTLTRMAEYNDAAILAGNMGFTVDTSSFDNELAACKNVFAEYGYLSKGQVDSQEAVNAAIDEMIAKLKANGLDKIISETQAQLDAWRASN